MVRPTRSPRCWCMAPIRPLRMPAVPRLSRLPWQAITLQSSQRCNAMALDSELDVTEGDTVEVVFSALKPQLAPPPVTVMWRLEEWLNRARCRKNPRAPGRAGATVGGSVILGGAAMSRFRCCQTVLAAALWGAVAAASEAEPRAASPVDGTLTAIVGATVVHPELEGAAASSSHSTVIIAGKRINAVGPATTTKMPRGARVIDGHGKWVIPGLIDSHVHFFQSGNLRSEEHTSELQSRLHLVCRLLLEKKNKKLVAQRASNIRAHALHGRSV